MTQEEIKKLIERYPYLLPRNVWTDEVIEGYDYTYISGIESPYGWDRLFFQMCEDIRKPLIDAGYIDKFRLYHITEEDNTLICYFNSAPSEVVDIIEKYEAMSHYVCTCCGKPATYRETRGYVASFCDDCLKDSARRMEAKLIEFKPYYVQPGYERGIGHYEKTVSFEDEWNRYVKENGYDSQGT